jgi:hypothetical protein
MLCGCFTHDPFGIFSAAGQKVLSFQRDPAIAVSMPWQNSEPSWLRAITIFNRPVTPDFQRFVTSWFLEPGAWADCGLNACPSAAQ